jgi:hypothetical protein
MIYSLLEISISALIPAKVFLTSSVPPTAALLRHQFAIANQEIENNDTKLANTIKSLGIFGRW